LLNKPNPLFYKKSLKILKGSQNSQIVEGKTTQWPKQKGQ